MKIGFIVFAQNNYITFFEQYYKSFKQNFLPDVDKKFIIIVNMSDYEDTLNYITSFSDNDCEVVVNENKSDYDTYFINKAYHIIQLCDKDYIKYCDYVLISNVNFNCSKHIERFDQIHDESKLITLTRDNNIANSEYDYEQNPYSSCYINKELGKYYVRGGYVFGKPEYVKKLYVDVKNLLIEDFNNSIKTIWQDESALNKLVYLKESYFNILPVDATYQIGNKSDKIVFKDVYFTIIEKRWFFKDYNFNVALKFDYPKPYDFFLLTIYGLLKIYKKEERYIGYFMHVGNKELYECLLCNTGSIVLKQLDSENYFTINFDIKYKIWR
jgi:hypothetical protein